MSATGRSEANAPAASDVATRLEEADFVRLVAAADGDAVAALGLLADALGGRNTPYQATVAPLPERTERATDADLTVALGRQAGTADLALGIGSAASATAFDVVDTLAAPDPALALAGVVAAGEAPEGRLAEAADDAGLDRRPGVAVPTADHADGLAHSALLRAPFSGDVDAAGELLADIDDRSEDAGHRIASQVALAVAGDANGTERGTHAVERFLRPYDGGPFETVGGYADVLDALAKEDPGLAVACALGSVDTETALSAWRDHGSRAHAALDTARTGRYDGLFVARCESEAPIGTVARLLREFRSPEPVVLVIADGEAAALGPPASAVGETTRTAARAVDGDGAGTPTRARASFSGDETEFVVAFREAQ